MTETKTTLNTLKLISIIIITRDRPRELKRCLKSLFNNTYQNCEIVIVDNSSRKIKKKNQNFLKKKKSKYKIKYIQTKPCGFAALRQKAVDNSSGEVIMSIDDDCVAEETAISNIIDCFNSNRNIGVVGGYIKNVVGRGKGKYKGRGRIGENGTYLLTKDIEKAEVFGGANMSYRKKAFKEVGGYDLFFSQGYEEADLIYKIKKAGYETKYEPSVKIKHIPSDKIFRTTWRNMNITRLYFFFKHKMPDSMGEWFKFFKIELKLFINDINQILPNLSRIYSQKSGKKNENKEQKYIKKINLFNKILEIYIRIFFEGFKIVTARLLIPGLIYRARKKNYFEKN
ncbi:MAG: glycosyltransferase family 2 protein [Elusimicrobiota bacterium]